MLEAPVLRFKVSVAFGPRVCRVSLAVSCLVQHSPLSSLTVPHMISKDRVTAEVKPKETEIADTVLALFQVLISCIGSQPLTKHLDLCLGTYQNEVLWCSVSRSRF